MNILRAYSSILGSTDDYIACLFALNSSLIQLDCLVDPRHRDAVKRLIELLKEVTIDGFRQGLFDHAAHCIRELPPFT